MKVSQDTDPGGRRRNHDEDICDIGNDIDLLLEYEEKDREDAVEAVDGHEGKRDAMDSTELVDLVELSNGNNVDETRKGKAFRLAGSGHEVITISGTHRTATEIRTELRIQNNACHS